MDIKYYNINLWDFLVSLCSGILFTIFLFLDLFIFNVITIEQIRLLNNINLGFFILLIPTLLIIGLVIDALANIFEKNIIKRIYDTNKEHDDVKKLSNYIQKRFIKKELRKLIIPYHWCKNFLIQKGIKTNYTNFLSKYGFYRTIAFLFYLNSLIFMIKGLFNSVNTSFILLAIVQLVIAIIMTKRSKTFFEHTGKDVLTHFLIAKSH